MAWCERTIVVKLLKGCYLGAPNEIVRVEYNAGIKACEKGLARIHEWRPSVKRHKPDVAKGGVNGA